MFARPSATVRSPMTTVLASNSGVESDGDVAVRLVHGDVAFGSAAEFARPAASTTTTALTVLEPPRRTTPHDEEIQHLVGALAVAAKRRNHRRRDDTRLAAGAFVQLTGQGDRRHQQTGSKRISAEHLEPMHAATAIQP